MENVKEIDKIGQRLTAHNGKHAIFTSTSRIDGIVEIEF